MNLLLPAEVVTSVDLSLDGEFKSRRDSVVALSKAITSAEGNQYDLASQQLAIVARMRRDIDAAREATKRPVLELGRKIDKLANDAAFPLVEEEARLKGLIASEDSARRKRQEEERIAAEKKRREIEDEAKKKADEVKRKAEEEARSKIAEASKTGDLDFEEHTLDEAELSCREADSEAEKILKDASQKAASVTQYLAPKPAAHSSREVWEYEVTDLAILTLRHPSLVKIEPKRREILGALAAGVTIAGIRAYKVTAVQAGRVS